MAKFFIAWIVLVVIAAIAIPFVYSMETPTDPEYMVSGTPVNVTAEMIHGFVPQMPEYLLPAILVVGVLAIVSVLLLIYRRH